MAAVSPFNRNYAHYSLFDKDYHYSGKLAFPCALCKMKICAYSRIPNERNSKMHFKKRHPDDVPDYATSCNACLIEHHASPKHKFSCAFIHSFPKWNVAKPMSTSVRNFTIRIKGKGYNIEELDDLEYEDHIMIYNEEIQVQTREIYLILSILRAAAKLDNVRVGGSKKDIEFFKILAKTYETDGKWVAIIFDQTLFFLYLEVMDDEEVADTEKSLEVTSFLYHGTYDMTDSEFPEGIYDTSAEESDF
jgi:hypothetical protein